MEQLGTLIARRAEHQPGSIFLSDVSGRRRLTYADLLQQVERWGAYLDDEQVPFGGRVLLQLDEPLDLAVAHLAVLATGRCSVPVDPAAPAGEVSRTVRATTPSLVVRRVANLPDARQLGADCKSRLAGEHGAHPAGTMPLHACGSVQLHTSGSTGEPKVVELSEASLLHVARCVADHNRLTACDVGYNPLPLFHINGQVVALLATLLAGSRLVLDSKFSRTGFAALLDSHRVTWVNAVPAILTILAADPVPPAASRLRFVRSASAPLPVAVRQSIERRWNTVVVESYGMTEAASQITATPIEGGAPAGSAGRPVGTEVQVRDGRLWIRGPGVIRSYRDGAAADRFDADGWLDTRDLGRIDAAGFVYVLGRADDVINRGGELIYPREVEEILAADPRVREAVVIGRPDPVLGEVPVACVVADPAEFGDLLDALRARCEAELSPFKRPVDMRIVASLPRASTGKIRRRDVLSSPALQEGLPR